MNLWIENVHYLAGKLQLEIHHEFTGRIAGIFGPSGSGKTTLLELIAGFRKPNAGVIRFGKRILNNSAQNVYLPSHRRNIGYVPQDLALFPHLSVEANILYGCRRKEGNSAPAVHEIVRLLDLEPLLHRQTTLLSGGEKQRVAFARAVLASPELLLMDEPLSNLNQELKVRVKSLILMVRDQFGIPILFVSHDADDMAALCDQVMVIDHGKNMESGTPETIFTSDAQPHYRLRP